MLPVGREPTLAAVAIEITNSASYIAPEEPSRRSAAWPPGRTESFVHAPSVHGLTRQHLIPYRGTGLSSDHGSRLRASLGARIMRLTYTRAPSAGRGVRDALRRIGAASHQGQRHPLGLGPGRWCRGGRSRVGREGSQLLLVLPLRLRRTWIGNHDAHRGIRVAERCLGRLNRPCDIHRARQAVSETGLRSRQVAAAAGVNIETLRYYESRGLLRERHNGFHTVRSNWATFGWCSGLWRNRTVMGPGLVAPGKEYAPPSEGGFYRGRAPSMVDPPRRKDVPGYPGDIIAQ